MESSPHRWPGTSGSTDLVALAVAAGVISFAFALAVHGLFDPPKNSRDSSLLMMAELRSAWAAPFWAGLLSGVWGGPSPRSPGRIATATVGSIAVAVGVVVYVSVFVDSAPGLFGLAIHWAAAGCAGGAIGHYLGTDDEPRAPD